MKKSVLLLAAVYVTSASWAQDLKRKEHKSMLRMKNHVSYLASDELEGRASGSQGERLSAAYIAEQFKKSKLIPLGNEGNYYQMFDFATLRIATEKCELFINGMPFRLFKEFYPLSPTVNKGMYEGEAVFVAHGIVDKELERDDYKGKDVSGKAVFIRYELPDDKEKSTYASWQGIQTRVDEAIKHGAKSVIFYLKDRSATKAPEGTLNLYTHGSIPVVFFSGDLFFAPDDALKIRVKSDIMEQRDTAINVIGFKDNKAKHTVVVCAHHDHLGRGEISGSREEQSGQIHNGADDNASGVAAMIELSRSIRKNKRKHRNANYLFVAFSAEELGLLGSKYFTQNSPIDLVSINYVMNMDMVGKLDSTSKVLVLNGIGTSPSWKTALLSVPLDTLKIARIQTSDGGMGASDHTSFYLKGIPAVHFFTGQHQDYHKAGDDPEKLNYAGQVWITQFMEQMMIVLNQQGKMEFTPTSDQSSGRMRFKVTLGVMPDYIFDGEGLRLDGVKDGGPAQMAGLQAGDIIIGLAGKPVSNIKSYMLILSELEESSEIQVQFRRNKEIFEKIVKL